MNFLKIFQPFMNACKSKKYSIPVLNYMKVENGTATISDMETWVSFKAPDLDDGLYNLINSEPFKTDADINDFPVFPSGERTSVLTTDTCHILNLVKCVDDDPLRVHMQGIHVTNKSLAASDAHVLRWIYPTYYYIKGDFDEIFIPTKPLLIMAKEEPMVTIQKIGTMYIEFSFPGCTITQRIIDGRYPNWEGVIPDYKHSNTVSFLITPNQVSEIVKTVKAFNNPSELIKVSVTPDKKACLTHANIEMGLKKSWETNFCETPDRKPDAIIMPMMLLNDNNHDKEAYDILGFKGTLVDRGRGLYKGNITIGYIEEKNLNGVSRALGVWFEDSKAVPFYGTINGVTESPKPEAMPEEPSETSEEAPALPDETETQPEPEQDQTPEPTPAPIPEPEPKPIPTPQAETPATPRTKVTPAPEPIHIVEYSPKAIAVFGSTKQFKDEFLKIWGRWVPLTDPASGTKRNAWIFSKKREAQVREIIKAA